MIECTSTGAYLARGQWVPADGHAPEALAALGFDAAAVAGAKKGTIAWGILQDHNTSGDEDNLKIKFDAMASHDITFVGIIQTARASGLEKFPLPYVLTNCHNSLCAVGGTINEDDHRFGLSAAKKYGGIFVPPHLAVIHQYMREKFAGCGKMILGSDSHTRYGALGTMAIGEGGGELAKQLLGRTYDVARPGVVAVYLTGALPVGCGPHDVAIALVGALFKSGYVKNKVMEFIGPGVASLRQDTRNAIDAMTTETTCLHLGDGRDHPAVPDRPRPRGGLQAPGPGRPGLLRRRGKGGPVGHPAHDRPAHAPLQRLHHRGAERQPGGHPPRLRAGRPEAGGPHRRQAGPVLQDRERQAAGGPGRHRGLRRRSVRQHHRGGVHPQGPHRRLRRVFPQRLPRQPAGHDGSGQGRGPVQPDGFGRHHPHRLLRAVLRRGRRAVQRGAVHPAHHPQLPQPRGLQAGRGPAGGRRPDGCPQHRGHHGQRRHPDSGHRHRLRPHRPRLRVWAPTSRTGPRSPRWGTICC